MKNHYFDDNITIHITLPKKQSKLLANALLLIKTIGFGNITIKNFRILDSSYFNDRLQEKIYIVPPCKNNNFHFPLVYVEDQKLWVELERLIYSAYLKAINEKEVILNEDVNPDSIKL